MKITPNTKQCLNGSITATELAAFIRQTIEIPEGATIEFQATVDGGDDQMPVTDAYPLQFTAEWEGNKSAEQTVPARAVVNVKLP